jgi:type I restriction-modification system DNA methylase subunit
VDYIVKNTVGKLVEGKKPGPRGAVSKLKILDPACGSGSFLLGAYQYLLDWHRDQYVNDDPEKWAKGKTPRLYRTYKEEWRLTTDERKRILLNNIYGVDIDPQAVEVTKLSLLLKVLEGEDEQSIGKQIALFQERVLPDLANNIKCGNSLIGPDFYDNQQLNLLNEDEIFRVNVFDWGTEFSEIIKNGGFDAVIGNPPYLSMEDMEQIHRDYYYGKDIGNKSRYATAMHKSNLYSIFFERAITLASKGSFVGLITPYSWLSNSSFANLRKIFVTETTINTMHFFPVGVFQDAGIATGIIILNKRSPKNSTASVFDLRTFPVNDLANSIYVKSTEKRIPINVFRKTSDYIFNISWDEKETSIFDKIEKHPTTLGDIVNIDRGCDTANNQKYTKTSTIRSMFWSFLA